VTQGKNLFPEELETLLQTHTAIANASVLALPDPVRGSKVIALLQLSQNSPQEVSTTAQALTQWCQEHTESFKIPRQFWLCKEWPRTASGKTDHMQLHHMLLQTIENPNGHLPLSSSCLQLLS